MNDMRMIDRATGMQETKISAKGVDVHYGDNHAIKNVTVDIEDKTVPSAAAP